MADSTPWKDKDQPTWLDEQIRRFSAANAAAGHQTRGGWVGGIAPAFGSWPRWKQAEYVAKWEIDIQNKQIKTAKNGVHELKVEIKRLEALKAAAETSDAKAEYQRQIDTKQSYLKVAQDRVVQYTAELTTLRKKFATSKVGGATATGATGAVTGPTAPAGGGNPTNKPMEYNILSVQEAYFTSRPEFLLETMESSLSKNSKGLTSSVANDTPKNSGKLVAADLWMDGKATKGMITTWAQSDAYYQDSATADQHLLGQKASNAQFPPQGFRFQYNPGSISMAYAGTPLVDPNFEASGQDKFNLVGTGVTQSTIQFQILINRMFDMKYYWREEDGGQAAGTLKVPSSDIYGPGVDLPTKTQKAIYNLGTMYDVEYLLRTIMGYTMKSYMRDYSYFKDGGTADMGFLGARPVELHLGKNLRYLVYVTGINIEHVIFDSRMVPIFSNLSITCSRLPDYQQVAPGGTK